MEQVRLETEGTVAIMRMAHGANNAIGQRMVAELAEALTAVRADTTIRALVLASGIDRYFAIGLDLPELYPLPKDGFDAFMRSFERVCMDLYTLPRPTVAAVSGHATAGGAVLALCCDRRVMAAGRSVMGLNEARLGVPVPYLVDRIVRDLVDGRTSRDVLEGGEFMHVDELRAAGLVDAVAPPERVEAEAIAMATAVAAHPVAALEAIKRNRTETVVSSVLPHLEARHREFVDLWYSEPARARLREAMERF